MFCPEIEEDHLKTRVLLDRGTADCRVLVVSFQALGRRIAMIPALSGRWFDITRGQRMLDRARDILVDHFNAMQKESGKFQVPAEFTSGQRQWVTSVDLSVSVEPELEKEENDLMAMLGAATRMTGRAELQKVGRCLDWLYPDELDRPVLRDAEVEELHKLLSGKQRRPVLLVGEPQVGKTSVIHECVYRRVSKRQTPHTSRNNFWLLAPQRLISGMMYVGQWESRVTAIVEESIKQDHIL
jgi:ATP-dependent Clp protease ATP-binding subunit ClpC